MDSNSAELLSNITNIVSNSSTTAYHVDVFFVVFFPILIIVTTVLNLATILAFWRLPTLRDTPSELLILNLSCADLITGAVLLPLISPLYMFKGYWPLGENGCRMVLLFLNMGVNGSLYALVTISVDRFLLVYMDYPRYIKRVTRTKVYKVIAVGWIFSFGTVLCELGLWVSSKRSDESAMIINYKLICLSPSRRLQSYALVYFPIVYFFPVILVCALSAGFFYQLQKRLNRRKREFGPSVRAVSMVSSSSAERPTSTDVTEMGVVSGAVQQSTTSRVNDVDVHPDGHADIRDRSKCVDRNRTVVARQILHRRQTINRYLKPGLTLVGLVIAMAICMIPYCIYVIIIEVGCEHCNNTDVLYGLLLLQFCNACLDPFIYALTRKRIRNFYISCVCPSKSQSYVM